MDTFSSLINQNHCGASIKHDTKYVHIPLETQMNQLQIELLKGLFQAIEIEENRRE